MAIDTNSIPALDLSLLIVNGNRADQETAISLSNPRNRASISPGWPEARIDRQRSESGKSSGWTALCHPQSQASASFMPVYSHQRRLSKSKRPSGSAVHTNPEARQHAAEPFSIPVFSSVGVKSAIYPPMSIILWCDAAMAVLAHLARDQSVAPSFIHPPPALAPLRASSTTRLRELLSALGRSKCQRLRAINAVGSHASLAQDSGQLRTALLER